jgi:hypothetical protein
MYEALDDLRELKLFVENRLSKKDCKTFNKLLTRYIISTKNDLKELLNQGR